MKTRRIRANPQSTLQRFAPSQSRDEYYQNGGNLPFGACVLVYNMAFEKRVLKEMGESLRG